MGKDYWGWCLEMPSSNSSKKLELVGVKIKNYRSCRMFPENGEYLKIGKFTTFIGKNDVGKSNILKAIETVCRNHSISDDDLHKGIEENCEISLLFKVPENLKEMLRKEFDLSEVNDNIEIKATFDDVKKPKKGSYTANDKKITHNKLSKYIPDILFIPAGKNLEDEINFKRDTITSKLLLPIIERTSERKTRTGSVFQLKEKLKRAILDETEEIRKSLKEELSKMWNEVEDVLIDIPELKLDKAFNPAISVKDRFNEKEIPALYRGSGLQRYLILAMLEIYRKLEIGEGYVLIMEEPEIFLHIGAQKKMCSILQDISKNGQVIISTHSNIFIDKSDLSATYLLFKENGETKLRKFEGDKEILDELGISPSDIFLTNGIIFVEGPSDVEIVNNFAGAIFSNWDENNITVFPIGGSNIEHHDPETLREVNPNIAVILDSDVISSSSSLPENKKNLKQKFESAGIPVYFWKKNDHYVRTIENLFTRRAIESALNIFLESEIGEYDDVPAIINKKLYERYNDCNSDNPENEERWRELHSRGNLYNKIRHGKKISKKMVESGEIPDSVKEILNEIVNNRFRT